MPIRWFLGLVLEIEQIEFVKPVAKRIEDEYEDDGIPSVFSTSSSRQLVWAHSWNSEPQNIEQEISNDEVWNRFALTISD
jgi:hypothetical protein